MQTDVRKLKRSSQSQSFASIVFETLISRSLFLPCRFNSFLPFCTLFLSFQLSLPFATSFLSFQHFNPVHLPLPFASSRSCRYVLPFVSSLSYRSFTCSYRCHSSISIVTSFPWFHVSTPALPSLVRPFRFNCFLPFSTLFLSFQLFPSIRYFLPFASTLSSRSCTSSFVSSHSCRYVLPVVLSIHILCHGRLEKIRFAEKTTFFQVWRVQQSGLVFAILAATCGYLWPLAATCSLDEMSSFLSKRKWTLLPK